MTQSTNQIRQNEGGFTLVELAIVMIIIGLLIGGILKGQELITNARVSSTVAQVKAVESGISGFRDKYAALPGDLSNVTNRLPNCGAGVACATDGAGGTLGNGTIETGAATDLNSGVAIGDEAGLAFIHLGAAGMLGGVDPSTTTAAGLGAGTSHPTTPLGGAWLIGTTSAASAPTAVILNTGMVAGVYVASTSNLAAPTVADDVQVMTPSNAATVDRKLDDGQPNSGSIRAIGVGGNTTTNCASTNAIGGLYNEALGSTSCGIIAKVQ